VLRPGGIIRISVPDIDKIVKIYFKHLPYFQHEDVSPWIGLIYGGQSSQYDYHKTGFNANWLKSLLESAGFINCEEYPHSPHFIPGFQDDSLGNATFNEYISLNMRALKPY
jgi:predicted SAM-dependent methyltransferase